jgi:hydrogenase nickel incorporation protein HypB
MEIKVLKNILSANDQLAQKNRELLDSKGITAINLMSSPGAGKTSLILHTIKKLKDRVKIGIIEGDISSSYDAEKVGKEGVPVVQLIPRSLSPGCRNDSECALLTCRLMISNC